jgi:lipoprotein-anchoring transpeptidase ErfK/SrfK
MSHNTVMPSDSPTPNTPPKRGMFRVVLVAEAVLLITLLGILGYRFAMRNAAVADESNSATTSPSHAPKQTTPPPRKNNAPATQVGTNPPNRSPDTRETSSLPVLASPMILVEKSKQRLTLFDGRRIVKQYPASTGRDAGDKMREGDYRTPEGEFYVCVRNEKSKYTRALGLSYPDQLDARRGLRDGLITRQDHDRIVQAIQRHRQPLWNTPLGGQIMIHGDRRGGRTTQGCIALEDRDILELFPRIPLGTRVIIKP